MDDSENQNDAPLQPDETGSEDDTVVEQKDPSDALTPDHPRFKQVLTENKDLKQRLSDLEIRINQRQTTTGDEDLTQEERDSMEKIKRQLAKDGFMTKADFEREVQVDRIASNLESLTDKYNGKNGFPQFVAEDVVGHAKKNGFGDHFEAAYKDLHEDAYVEARAKQRAGQLTPPRSEKPTGTDRTVPGGELTEEQIANMSDAEYEKVRAKIHAGLKASVKGK